MPRVIKQKICDISPALAYETVKDFARYPEFLPWCSGARLRSQTQDEHGHDIIIADLIIRYKFFSEVFTTQVTCNPQTLNIDIEYLSGPFKHLNSYWRFNTTEHSEQSSIEFMIDFSMKIGPLQSVIGLFFEHAMQQMIAAFEQRFLHIKHTQA